MLTITVLYEIINVLLMYASIERTARYSNHPRAHTVIWVGVGWPCEKFPPLQARSYRVYQATKTLLFSSPFILLRCVMEIQFAQNLRWLGKLH